MSPLAAPRGGPLVATAARVAARPARPTVWLVAGLLSLAGVAGAAYWAGHTVGAQTAASPGAAQAATAGLPAPLYGPASPPSPAPTTAATGTGGHGSATPVPGPAPTANPAHGLAGAVPACPQCGVVEAVQAVQHKGQASGVGAVAGGVLGGVLGHQMGGGNGRTAMTVLGAVGGGMAGNEVEKRSKATTTYRVQVRTDSGALRTVEQRTAPAVGQRVRIEGSTLHAIS